jgi:hypothetical protein
VIPAFIDGTLTGAAAKGQRIAVAVNGVVQAVATSYQSGDEIRFGAPLPASAFRRGRNALAIFVVTGRKESRRLSPVEGLPLS